MASAKKSTTNASLTITAVLVTYNPNLKELKETVKAIVPQVNYVVLVDNGSLIDINKWGKSLGVAKIRTIQLHTNKGISAAQNIGVQYAIKFCSDFVLFLDQDSIPHINMVESLVIAHCRLAEQGHNISAIGPRYIDKISGYPTNFLRIGRFGIHTVVCKHNDDEFIQVDLLIASGSLISLQDLLDIGGMDEGLFIDHVDVEWIFRARLKGYRAWGHCKATMEHSIGEYRLRVWFLRWRNIPFHNPIRYYYLFRNGIELSRRKYIPSSWKFYNFVRLVQFGIIMSIVHPKRAEVLRMIFRGVMDGIRHRSGPFLDL